MNASQSFISQRNAIITPAIFQKAWGIRYLIAKAHAVAEDSAGNIYIAGSCCGGTNESFSQATVLKFSSDGKLLWKNTLVDAAIAGSGLYAMALDSTGNVYLAGFELVDPTTTSPLMLNLLLLKIDPNGQLVWQIRWNGNTNAVGTGVALDAAGEIFVTGTSDVSDGNPSGVLLLKFSPSGALVWQKTWRYLNDAYQFDSAKGIAVDSSGNAYIVGSVVGTYTKNTLPLLLKFNSTGAVQWQRTWGVFGGTSDVITANSVALDSDGSVLVTGRASYINPFNLFEGVPLLKFDSLGTLFSQVILPAHAIAEGLAAAPSGHVMIVGTQNGGIMMLDFLPLGDLYRGVIVDPGTGDEATGISVSPSGSFAVSGDVTGVPSSVWDSVNETSNASPFNPTTPAGVLSTLQGGLVNASGYLRDAGGSFAVLGPTNAYVLNAYSLTLSAPDPPGVLASVLGTNNVTLSWNPPLHDGGLKVLGYHVYKGLRNGSETFYANLSLVRSYTDTALTWGATYYYYVTAFNAYGESSPTLRVKVELGGWNLILPEWEILALVSGSAIVFVSIFFLRRRSRSLKL